MSIETTRRYGSLTTASALGALKDTRRAAGRAAAILAMGIVVACFPMLPAGASGLADRVSLEEAKQHLDSQEFDTAYTQFYELFKHDPGNPDINFLLGRAAFGNRDYEAAIMAFERVLIARPDAARVKLEMARCYMELGSIETARQYFEEVLATDPPATVRENILYYLRAIRQTTRQHFLSGRIILGVDWDDNANVAPTNPDIEITTALGDVIPVFVDRPERDRISSSTLNLNYLYRPLDSKVSWKISGLNYNAVYRDTHDLDVNLFDLKAGMSLQANRITWDIYGIASHLNLDYASYQHSWGAGTGFSVFVRPNLAFILDARYKKKDYRETHERDADNISVGFGPVFSLGPHRITTTLSWEKEYAREEVNSYTRMSAIASYERRLPYGASFLASYWYQGTGYEERDPLFDKKRSDDVQYLTAGLSKSLWQSAAQGTAVFVNAGHTYTRSDSNIELYQYTKNVTSVSVSFVF